MITIALCCVLALWLELQVYRERLFSFTAPIRSLATGGKSTGGGGDKQASNRLSSIKSPFCYAKIGWQVQKTSNAKS